MEQKELEAMIASEVAKATVVRKGEFSTTSNEEVIDLHKSASKDEKVMRSMEYGKSKILSNSIQAVAVNNDLKNGDTSTKSDNRVKLHMYRESLKNKSI